MIWFLLSNSFLFSGWLWILFLLPLFWCYYHFWRLLSHFFLFCLQFDDCFCFCNLLNNALQHYFAFETLVTFEVSTHVPSLFFVTPLPHLCSFKRVLSFIFSNSLSLCFSHPCNGFSLAPWYFSSMFFFIIKGLPTRDKLVHFTNQNLSCWLCHWEKESQTHLLEECSVAEGFLQAMERKCILLNVFFSF